MLSAVTTRRKGQRGVEVREEGRRGGGKEGRRGRSTDGGRKHGLIIKLLLHPIHQIAAVLPGTYFHGLFARYQLRNLSGTVQNNRVGVLCTPAASCMGEGFAFLNVTPSAHWYSQTGPGSQPAHMTGQLSAVHASAMLRKSRG